MSASSSSFVPTGNVIGSAINYSILFIKKFPHNMTQEKIEEIASKYGSVIKCVVKQATGVDGIVKKLNQCHLTFVTKEDAQNASQKLYMDNEMNPNAQLQVDFFQNRVARMIERDNKNPVIN